MHIVIIPSERYGDADEPLAGIFQRDQAKALKRAGLTVGIVAALPRSLRHLRWKNLKSPRGIERTDDDGIPVYLYQGWRWIPGRFPFLPDRWYVSIGERVFSQYVRDHGLPDLVHAHNALWAGAIAAVLKRRWGVPYVLTEHSSAHLRGTIPSWRKQVVKRALADASACLVVSRALGAALEREYPEVASRWEWVPNLLDRMFEEYACLNKRHTTGASLFRFLSIGSLVPVKNHAGLLKAFAHAFNHDKTVQLRIGGDGPLRRQLEELSWRLGIAKQVVFLGQLTREQVLVEMQLCDAFVLPSYYETFSVVLIEALACGCPIVATACGGPDQIVTEENGLLVPPGDELALAEALKQMRQKAKTYNREAIREKCLARFGEKTVVDQLLRIYSRIIGGV